MESKRKRRHSDSLLHKRCSIRRKFPSRARARPRHPEFEAGGIQRVRGPRLVRCIPDPATKPARPHKKREIISEGVNEIPNERRGTPGRRLWTANQTSSTQSTAPRPFSSPRPSVTRCTTRYSLTYLLVPVLLPPFSSSFTSSFLRVSAFGSMYVSSNTRTHTRIFSLSLSLSTLHRFFDFRRRMRLPAPEIFLLLGRNLRNWLP